jgi:hypothetical protein
MKSRVSFLLHCPHLPPGPLFVECTDRILSRFKREVLRKKPLPHRDQGDLSLSESASSMDDDYTDGNTVQDIHDILSAYYQVASKRFVDNVCLQACDYYLIGGRSTPLNLLTPLFVNRLKAEQLEGIAGEDAILKRGRELLKKEIAELEAGKRVLL